jgi:hypothetical protein
VYSSIAQTYQDLEDYNNSLEYYKLELNALNEDITDCESVRDDLLNEKNFKNFFLLNKGLQILDKYCLYQRKN